MEKMTSESSRSFGKVFDSFASDYDKHRPLYPSELLDYACEQASLKKGDKVLELGCGSGQLTKALAKKGYQVTALEPGKKLIEFAKKNTRAYAIDFINTKFEDADLPKHDYRAIFAASSFHWIDPDISWHKTAGFLATDGALALIQHFGLNESQTRNDLALQFEALNKFAPELAARWPKYYSLDEILDGVDKRKKNISEAWSWLGDYDIEREEVSRLFKETQIAAKVDLLEQTADELIAVLRTLSAYSSLPPKQRASLEEALAQICKDLDRPIKSSTVTVLMMAKRS